MAHLDEIGEAQVDAARLLRNLGVANGDVGHDGQQQALQGLLEAVGKPLSPRHLGAEGGRGSESVSTSPAMLRQRSATVGKQCSG